MTIFRACGIFLVFFAFSSATACARESLEPLACVGVSAENAGRDLVFQRITSAAKEFGYTRAELASNSAMGFNGVAPNRHLLVQEIQPGEYVILVYAREDASSLVIKDPAEIASRIAGIVGSEQSSFSIHECPAPREAK